MPRKLIEITAYTKFGEYYGCISITVMAEFGKAHLTKS